MVNAILLSLAALAATFHSYIPLKDSQAATDRSLRQLQRLEGGNEEKVRLGLYAWETMFSNSNLAELCNQK